MSKKDGKYSWKIWWLLIAVIIACVLIPVFISLFYDWLPQWLNKTRFKTHITAGDMLSFCAAALSAIGTIFLGCITFKQAKQLADQEDKREKSNVKRPFIIVDGVYTDKELKNHISCNDNEFSASLSEDKCFIVFKNIGTGPALKVKMDFLTFGECEEDISLTYLLPENTITISLKPSAHSHQSVSNITYENMVGFKYRQNIEINGSSEQNFDDLQECTEEYYKISVSQTYPQEEI